MYKTLSSKILYVVPLIFLIIILSRITYSYYDIKVQSYDFAKSEAEVLNSYVMANRNYYQNLYINHTIDLNEKTVVGLPAYAARTISEEFSADNPFKIHIQTVSDRARNPVNAAGKDELKAIEYFRKNIDETDYFSDENSEFYQYANVLKIDKKCLTCHGDKKDAPLFIQKKYDNSYNYKIGDVRGIMSIQIPKETLNKHFYRYFFYSVLYDLLLFSILFFAIYQLIKYSKRTNTFLESEVLTKTKELKKTLITDTLTLLPNRLQLIEELKSSQKNKLKYLALLNIDNFKDINDFYGHNIGDEILKYISSSIQNISKDEENELYKLPSDEYAIYSTKCTSQNEFVEKVHHIIMTIQQEAYLIKDHAIFVTFSCGIASDEEDLLTKADMALQSSKKDQKNLTIYDSSLDLTTKIQENIKGIELLKDAIKNDRFTPFYQPIYNLKTESIEKYEVLARIIDVNNNIIAPYYFLNIALKSKLYPNITQAMIEKSFKFFKDKNFEFSINISINDIVNPKTNDFIIQKLTEFPNPKKIVFEILESEKAGNYQELKKFIDQVKVFGCKIAIDDFGSGYSNFSHILELNIDYLKIDASLVKYITTDINSKKITQTIITFASQLEIKTIAEFVEDQEALDLLNEMGVDFIQGYKIGKPEPTLVDSK